MRAAAFLTFVALASGALAGCVTNPLAGETVENAAVDVPFASPLFDGWIHESLDVASEGGLQGVQVHVDLFRPDPTTYTGADPADAEAPVPVIVHASPYHWGKDSDTRFPHYPVNDWILEEMIPRGYAFAAVELPGTGGSTGCWDFMGPQETTAMAAAVDWLGSQSWSNGKVGMIGISYDGMTQVMAASRKPEHLATIVPMAPLTHAYAGVYMNGVPYTGFWGGAQALYTAFYGAALVPYHTPERMPGWAQKLPDQAACAPENVAGGMLNLGDYNDYYAARDFRKSAKEITIPVFFTQGFMDLNVRADNAFPYVNDLTGPTMAWLFQGYHIWPNATFAGRDDFYLTLHKWFDRWLKGVENGIENQLGFHVQDSEGRWRKETTWPAPDAAPRALTLSGGKLTAGEAATGSAAFIDDANAYWEVGASRPIHDPVPGYLTYESDAFTEETHVAGPVTLHLQIASSGTRGQVVAELLDCAPGMEDCRHVTIGAMNLLHRNGLEQSENLPPNEAVTVTFDLQPRDYAFQQGRAPVLVLSGSNVYHFQPEPTRNLITVHEGGDSPSALVFPVADVNDDATYLMGCGSALRDKDCYDPDLEDRTADSPGGEASRNNL